MSWVKAFHPNGDFEYFPSLSACCEAYGINHHETLQRLIDSGQLAPDGRTFFDVPTDWEMKKLEGKCVGL